jgi:hypothetical protein
MKPIRLSAHARGSWRVEQRALDLLLAGGEFRQAPEEMGPALFTFDRNPT